MNNKLAPHTFVTIYIYLPAVPFRYNIKSQAQPQSRALPGGFGSKEGLEDFINII